MWRLWERMGAAAKVYTKFYHLFPQPPLPKATNKKEARQGEWPDREQYQPQWKVYTCCRNITVESDDENGMTMSVFHHLGWVLAVSFITTYLPLRSCSFLSSQPSITHNIITITHFYRILVIICAWHFIIYDTTGPTLRGSSLLPRQHIFNFIP